MSVEVSQDDREKAIAETYTELANRIGIQRLSPDLVRGVLNEYDRTLRRNGWRPGGAPVTENTDLVAQWDKAATPDRHGHHDGAGFASSHWRAIRDALEAKPPTTPSEEQIIKVLAVHGYLARTGRSEPHCACGGWTESVQVLPYTTWQQHVSGAVLALFEQTANLNIAAQHMTEGINP